MSHTRKGKKAPGFEFWGVRGNRGASVDNPVQGGAGSIAKKLGSKSERAKLKSVTREAAQQDE